MLSLENLLIFIPTITLLVILPGPDFAMVSKISLFNGQKPAQAAAIGVTLGMCIHTILAMLGLSAIVASSAILFTSIKYIGAAYLFYIGISELIKSGKTKNSQSPNMPEDAINESRCSRYFYAGFLTNVTNPKAILYFMVLYPQFLNTDLPLSLQFLEMGVISALICLLWYIIVANLLTKIRFFFKSEKCQQWLMRFTGAIFIMFGFKLVAQEME